MTGSWFGIEKPYCDHERARVVIIPAPYEGTVSYGKGASRGPAAILKASPFIEFFDMALGYEPHLAGIHGLLPLKLPDDPWQAALAVKARAAEALETGRHPVMVGGEHSLSLGPISAAHERYPSLTVLQLDAHADLRDEYEGSRFSHACVMRRVAELGVDMAQVGVRAISLEEVEWLRDQGRQVMSARNILADQAWLEKVLERLSSHVYVSLDLDVLDPSVMPATGTPEPGGLSYHHLVDLALAIRASGKQVIGMDMVEFAPIDGIHYPDFTAASLLYTMIGAFFSG